MSLTRDFTVSAFVVWNNQVLLHRHPKLGKWFPPGGHIEHPELPDEAATRETLEETGLSVSLVSSDRLEYQPEAELPRQLTRPRGVQLEQISPDHEHIDLIYFARPAPNYDGAISSENAPFIWCDAARLAQLPLGNEVRAWCELALHELALRELA
jgi:8-oxo-dGTP pyrophosphatase MutT (NUDIX family)